MTEQNTKSLEEQEASIEAIKKSLLNTTFQHYSNLIYFLKSLPFNQNHLGFHEAYINFDTGLLWIKELIANSQLILPEKKEKEEKLN